MIRDLRALPGSVDHLTAAERRAIGAILTADGFTYGVTYAVGRKRYRFERGEDGRTLAELTWTESGGLDPIARRQRVTFRWAAPDRNT